MQLCSWFHYKFVVVIISWALYIGCYLLVLVSEFGQFLFLLLPVAILFLFLPMPHLPFKNPVHSGGDFMKYLLLINFVKTHVFL